GAGRRERSRVGAATRDRRVIIRGDTIWMVSPIARVGGEMTRGRWIVAGIVLAGVAFATVQGLRPRPPPPVDVTTSAAKRGPITRGVTAAGQLEAPPTVKGSSNNLGDLVSVAV